MLAETHPAAIASSSMHGALAPASLSPPCDGFQTFHLASGGVRDTHDGDNAPGPLEEERDIFFCVFQLQRLLHRGTSLRGHFIDEHEHTFLLVRR
ncbi:hypothetical protein MTO96_008026 [Rhipicephalus appendiculatus]